MNRDHFIFDLDNRSATVVTRDRIITSIPNTGALKTPTGEHYSVQIVTTLPYGTTVLRHAATLGIAGPNGYFRYAWGPQDSEDPAYVVVDAVKEDAAVGDILETAQARHAAQFQGQENIAILQSAIETLTKRATAVLDKT